MDTAEIVRRLLNRPVTPERALKVLHLLETPGQLNEVLASLGEADRAIVEERLTTATVQAHFARRSR